MQKAEFSLVPQSAGLAELIVKAQNLAAASRAESTRRAMESSWNDVESWTQQHNLPSLINAPSPEAIALYLTDKASSLSPQTLTKKLSCVTQALRAAGYQGPSPASTRHPLVGAVLRGIRRTKGVTPGPNRKDPLLTEQIRLLVGTCGDTLQGIRDRAIILVGFAAGGVRRAQLSSADAAQFEFCEAGLIYHQGRSKNDQEGIGRKVGIPWGADPETTCPVRALQRWLQASCVTAGPIFRAINQRGRIADGALHPDSVNQIVKRHARLAGLDAESVGAHSLRSGFCTQASRNGASDHAIMRQSGHKCQKSLAQYVREARAFEDNASGSLGI